jgi:hypothetical protein
MTGRKNKKTCSFNCRRTKARRKFKQEIDEYKVERGCAKCGYNGHAAALDFNHLNPEEKKFNIGEAFANSFGRERVMNEIAKCEILCANCHRIYTYENNVTRLLKA